MGHRAGKLHSLAAAWASHVFAVLSHSIIPDTQRHGRAGPSFPIPALYAKSGRLAATSSDRSGNNVRIVSQADMTARICNVAVIGSVELIVQPAAKDAVGEMGVREDLSAARAGD